MRISNKQANLLANEIHERLKKTTVCEPSSEIKAKLKAWKKQRDKMYAEKEKLSKEIEAYDKHLRGIVGDKNISKIRGYWDEDNILAKLRESNTPSIQEIEDKIVLKAMFANEDDMENFVDNLVKEYSKKKVKA